MPIFDQDAAYRPPTENNADGENISTNHSDHSNIVRNEPLSVFHATLGIFTRIITDLFPQGRKEREPSLSDEEAIVNIESHDHHESPMRDSACDEPNSQESDVLDDHRAQNSGENGEVDSSLSVAAGILVKMGNSLGDDIPEEMDVDSNFQRVCDEHGSCSFKHFDIAKEPLDHHFLGATEQVTTIIFCPRQSPSGAGTAIAYYLLENASLERVIYSINGFQVLCGRKWTKKVQKEWSILEKNLPGVYKQTPFRDDFAL